MRLLLLLCSYLFPFLAFAQTTVSGRVFDGKSRYGLPGVSVLQTGTTNGTTCDVYGNFSLTVPETLDSVALTFSFIGSITQQRRVAAGTAIIIRLPRDEHRFDSDLTTSPTLLVGLASGLRYAPIGAEVQVFKTWSRRQLPIPVTASYQTNLVRNHALRFTLDLPGIPIHRFSLTEAVEYQHVQSIPANAALESYTAKVGLSFAPVSYSLLPSLLMGVGHSRLRAATSEPAFTSSGYGYTLGLRSYRLPLRCFGYVQATRWPGFWQWQGRLARNMAGLQAAVALNQFRSYAEVSLSVSRFFY
ncbi:carboxypeptidase-like regulatory domain-containing protein [Hymenobacter properus]|uniref:Carboxypeptidase-like regulatory domain-containing protein n=1 Tax=Hymenobacter properus TaxID=2791026 RepID=A0A931FJW4_9BACT|nr:carboxypeptidase-like regulatory domain-containing protein [Hymenobacter properus]MBF9143382.1 carboxypeptidase-like regulatory domain-containing protein [Hymenobacter properus]MBR7722193.1 carboxypeptidase-like regulatory domain-containing protein [Microvirga sp. SRT04]